MSTNVEKIVAAREEEEATSKSDERRGARRRSGLRRCAPTDGRQSYGGTTHLKWRMLVTASADSGCPASKSTNAARRSLQAERKRKRKRRVERGAKRKRGAEMTI